MRSLEIQNPVLDRTYKTRLASDYASGVTATAESNVSFSANDYLVFGEPSEELTEGKKLDSKSGSTTLTLASTLNFSHGKGTSIYKSIWDQVVIERRTSPSESFSVISTSAIQWDNPNNLTIYFDSDGTDDYGYRFRFYNSITLTYSEYSPTLEGTGFTRQQVGRLIEQVRLIANDVDRKIVSDDEIIRFFNRAQDIIYTHNPKFWFLLIDVYKQATGIACLANTKVYSLATYTTLGHLDTVRYHYNSGGTSELYHLIKKSSVEFDDIASNLNETADDWAYIYKLLPADSSSSKGYIQIYPTTKNTSVGTLYPNYYEKMANLDSVDDETQVPLPDLLVDYAIGQVERIKGNENKAKLYESVLVSESDNTTPSGLIMLDKLDMQQKQAVGQPRSLWNFKGQKAISRLFGNRRRMNRDYARENYME